MGLSLEEMVEKIITTVEQVNLGRLEKAINGPVWLTSKYGTKLVELLSTNAKYDEFCNHIQYLGNGGSQTGLKNLADWIVERAYVVGSNQSVQELNRYLDSNNIEIYEISLLANIYIHNDTRKEYIFCNGVSLIDESSIPNKLVATNIIHNLHNSILPFPRVESVLIKAFTQKRLHQSSYTDTFVHPNIESPIIDLEETKLCMILARQLRGVHSIGSGVIAPDNLPFIQSVSGWSMNSFKLPTIFGYILDVELNHANNLLEKFMNLDQRLKDNLKISIENFNNYCSSSTKVEKAISLRICLESIFLDSGRNDSIQLKISERGAFLLGNSIEEKNKIAAILKNTYDITSSAVHEGKFTKKDLEKISILDESAELAKQAIIKQIQNEETSWIEYSKYATYLKLYAR